MDANGIPQTYEMIVFALGTLVSSVLAQPRETYASDDPSGLHEKLQSIVDFHSAFWNCSFSFAVHNDTMEIAVAAGANDWATGDLWAVKANGERDYYCGELMEDGSINTDAEEPELD